MAINTPRLEPMQTRSKERRANREYELRLAVDHLLQRVSMLEYKIACMERRSEEKDRLLRIEKEHQHSRYFHRDELSLSLPSEQIKPDDISLEATQILVASSFPAEMSAGEEEDVTYTHHAIRASRAPLITSHTFSDDHPAQDLDLALTEHMATCQKATNVILTNGVGRLSLFLDGVEHLEGITWRCNRLLGDHEILCASYEDGENVGQETAPV